VIEVVYFAHGMESGPWGSKIRLLADIATNRGLTVESPDYSHTRDGREREAQLCRLLEEDSRARLLVGSSMGGWVSCRAANQHPPVGLFLMAPAFEMPEHPSAMIPDGVPTWIIHGWDDDVVPPKQSLDRSVGHRLLLVPDGHRLGATFGELGGFFANCLDTLGAIESSPH